MVFFLGGYGQRPRGRRRLYAFRFRIADESLRAALVQVKEQVIQLGGDGAYRPLLVSRSDGSVRALQDFAPELLGGGSCSCWRKGLRGQTWLPLICSREWWRRDSWRRGRAQAWRRGGQAAEEVPERVEALRARERRSALERAPSLQRSDTPRQGEVGGGERLGPRGTNEDARTLWIDWDGQGEGYKPWRTVCQESRHLDHAGLGLGGPDTALHMAKMMERQDVNPVSGRVMTLDADQRLLPREHLRPA